MAAIKTTRMTSVSKDLEKRKPVCTAERNAHCCIPLLESRFLKKLKIKLIVWSRNSTSEYLFEENKTLNICTHCSIIYISQYTGNNCPSMGKWIKKLQYLCNGILFSHKKKKKEWNLSIFNKMHGFQEHYTKLTEGHNGGVGLGAHFHSWAHQISTNCWKTSDKKDWNLTKRILYI